MGASAGARSCCNLLPVVPEMPWGVEGNPVLARWALTVFALALSQGARKFSTVHEKLSDVCRTNSLICLSDLQSCRTQPELQFRAMMHASRGQGILRELSVEGLTRRESAKQFGGSRSTSALLWHVALWKGLVLHANSSHPGMLVSDDRSAATLGQCCTCLKLSGRLATFMRPAR